MKKTYRGHIRNAALCLTAISLVMLSERFQEAGLVGFVAVEH